MKKIDKRLENLKLEIKETLVELDRAREAEYNAEPEFITSAILYTNSLKEKLNSLYEILHRDYPDL